MNQATDSALWVAPDPRELPALREHLADHLRSIPAHVLTAEVLRLGRGTLRPSPDPDLGAALLLADERRRLSHAQLFYVTPDITTLVLHAARNLKDTWDIQPHDLPARTGLMLFAEPMAEYVREDGKTVRIVAVSWGDTELIENPDGGLWLTFWSATDFAALTALGRSMGLSVTEAEKQARMQHAELTWDNEIYMPWGATRTVVSDPSEPDPGRTIDPTALAAATTTIDWLRVVHAGWIFCQPNTFTELAEQHLPRTMRRRAERAGHTPSPVRVVSVRHRARPRTATPSEPSGRTVGVRFPVAPFLRRQPYGPGRSLRRWTLVAGHWRGPDDAPVHISKKVNLIDTPFAEP